MKKYISILLACSALAVTGLTAAGCEKKDKADHWALVIWPTDQKEPQVHKEYPMNKDGLQACINEMNKQKSIPGLGCTGSYQGRYIPATEAAKFQITPDGVLKPR